MTIHPENKLENDPRIWRASQHKSSILPTVTSGFSELDHLLAGDGWPRGALIECHCPQTGIGEIELFRRAMALCCRQQETLFWVDPPHTPYVPALERADMTPEQFFLIRTTDDEDQVWTLEQLLQCPSSGLVMGWSRRRNPSHLRRLQLASENGDTMGIMMITSGPARAPSPAPVRIALAAANGQALDLEIQRQRGGQPGSLRLPLAPVIADAGIHRLGG